MIDTLDYEETESPVSKNDFSKIEMKNKICINVFCYENKLRQFTYQIKNLKIKWIYCLYLMKLSHIM